MIIDISLNIIALLLTYFWKDYNLFWKLFGIDGFFLAIYFTRIFVSSDLTKEQIVKISNSLYSWSAIDRYIYYTLNFAFYKSICMFFYLDKIPIIDELLLLTSMPCILNKIMGSDFYRPIRKYKKHIVKVLLSELMASMIKSYAKMYLTPRVDMKNVDVKYTDIMPVFDKYSEITTYIIDVLKNTLLIFGLSHVKVYSSKLYYKMLKYAYNYKTGDMLVSFNKDTATRCLQELIESRNWSQLSKPNVFKAIIHLYQTNEGESDIIQELIIDFNLTLGKFFTIWSIATFFEMLFIAPVMSFTLLTYKYGFNVKNLIFQCIGLFVGYYTKSYMLMCLICLFGVKIFFNWAAIKVYKAAWNSALNYGLTLMKRNSKVALSIVSTFGYCMMLRISSMDNWIIGGNVMYNLLTTNDKKKIVMLCLIVLTSQLSEYNPLHCLYNCVVVYTLYNIVGDVNNIWDLVVWLYNILRDKYDSIDARSLYFWRFEKRVFELMDTNEFPSMSDKLDTDRIKIMEPVLNINQELIIRELKSIDDDLSVFDLPHDKFLNEISVNEDGSEYIVERIDDDIVIVDNFCD